MGLASLQTHLMGVASRLSDSLSKPQNRFSHLKLSHNIYERIRHNGDGSSFHVVLETLNNTMGLNCLGVGGRNPRSVSTGDLSPSFLIHNPSLSEHCMKSDIPPLRIKLRERTRYDDRQKEAERWLPQRLGPNKGGH